MDDVAFASAAQDSDLEQRIPEWIDDLASECADACQHRWLLCTPHLLHDDARFCTGNEEGADRSVITHYEACAHGLMPLDQHSQCTLNPCYINLRLDAKSFAQHPEGPERCARVGSHERP